MKLSSLLNPGLIFFDIDGEDRETVYKNIIEKVKEHKINLEDATEELVQRVMQREDAISISYEKTFAFPHLRLDNIQDLYIVIGVLDKPIKLKPNDISETKIIIFSLISNTTSQIYLMALSAITRFLIKNGNIDKLAKTGSPENLISFLDAENVEVKHRITAEEIMVSSYAYVKKDDPITRVLDIFAAGKKMILPVIGGDKKLLGQIDAFDLVGRSIPKYMTLLENHQFLTSFEPFENLIKGENLTYVKDYITEPEMIISPDTPLIQVTLLLINKNIKNLFVVEDEKLLGIVSMQEIINNVLRG